MATVTPFATFMKLALPTVHPPKPTQHVFRLTLSREQLDILLKHDQGLEEGEEPMRIEFSQDGRGTLKVDSETAFALSHPRTSLPTGLTQRREEVYAYTPGSRPGTGTLDGHSVIPVGTPSFEALGEREEKEARIAGAGEKVRGRMEEEREKRMGRSIVVMDSQPPPSSSRASTPKTKGKSMTKSTVRQAKLLAPTLRGATKGKATPSTPNPSTASPRAKPSSTYTSQPMHTGGIPMDRDQASSSSSAASITPSSSSSSSAVPLASSSKLSVPPSQNPKLNHIGSSPVKPPVPAERSLGSKFKSRKNDVLGKMKGDDISIRMNIDMGEDTALNGSKRKRLGARHGKGKSEAPEEGEEEEDDGREEGEEAEEGEERETSSSSLQLRTPLNHTPNHRPSITKSTTSASKRELDKDTSTTLQPNKKMKVLGRPDVGRKVNNGDMEEGEEGEVSESDLSPLSDDHSLRELDGKLKPALPPPLQQPAAPLAPSLPPKSRDLSTAVIAKSSSSESLQSQLAAPPRNFIQTSKTKKGKTSRQTTDKKASNSTSASPLVANVNTAAGLDTSKIARPTSVTTSPLLTSRSKDAEKDASRPSTQPKPSLPLQSAPSPSTHSVTSLNGKKTTTTSAPSKPNTTIGAGPKVSSTTAKVKASAKLVKASSSSTVKKASKETISSQSRRRSDSVLTRDQDSEMAAVLADRQRRKQKGSKARNANGELYFSSSSEEDEVMEDMSPKSNQTLGQVNGKSVRSNGVHSSTAPAAGAAVSPAASTPASVEHQWVTNGRSVAVAPAPLHDHRPKLPTFRKKGEGMTSETDRVMTRPASSSSSNHTSTRTRHTTTNTILNKQGRGSIPIRESIGLTSPSIDYKVGHIGHDKRQHSQPKLNGNGNGNAGTSALDSKKVSSSKVSVVEHGHGKPSLVTASSGSTDRRVHEKSTNAAPAPKSGTKVKDPTSVHKGSTSNTTTATATATTTTTTQPFSVLKSSSLASKIKPTSSSSSLTCVQKTGLGSVNDIPSTSSSSSSKLRRLPPPPAPAPVPAPHPTLPPKTSSDSKWLHFNTLFENYQTLSQRYTKSRRQLDNMKKLVLIRQNQREAGEVIEDDFLIVNHQDLHRAIEDVKSLRGNLIKLKNSLETARNSCTLKV